MGSRKSTPRRGSAPNAPKLSSSERARIFKALADPRRVELVDTLAREGPQCGTDLAERLGISIALLCHHWEVLCEAGLLEKTRVGQIRYCALDVARLRDATGCWDGTCDERASKELPARKVSRKKIVVKVKSKVA